MKSNNRIKSANINLRDELASVINEEIDDLEVIVTVTKVDTAADLKSVKAYISVMPDKKIAKVFKFFKKHVFRLNNKLAKRVKMKYIPRIRFFYDSGHQNYVAVEEILKDLDGKEQ